MPDNVIDHAAASRTGPGNAVAAAVDVRLQQTVLPWWAKANALPDATGTPVAPAAAPSNATGTPVWQPRMIPPPLLGGPRHAAHARREVPTRGDEVDPMEQNWRLVTGYRENVRGQHIVITAFGTHEKVARCLRPLGNPNGQPLGWTEYVDQFDCYVDATYGRDRSAPGGRNKQPLTMLNCFEQYENDWCLPTFHGGYLSGSPSTAGSGLDLTQPAPATTYH